MIPWELAGLGSGVGVAGLNTVGVSHVGYRSGGSRARYQGQPGWIPGVGWAGHRGVAGLDAKGKPGWIPEWGKPG